MVADTKPRTGVGGFESPWWPHPTRALFSHPASSALLGAPPRARHHFCLWWTAYIFQRVGCLLGNFLTAPCAERFRARPTTPLSQALCGLVLAVVGGEVL